MARRLALLLLLPALLPASSGCSPKAPSVPSGTAGSAAGSASSVAGATSSQPAEKPAEPELPPFEKPTLAEVEAKADWQPMPVVDALKALTEELKKEKPLVSVKEALALKNDSDENNLKIRSGLGVQPESPADANLDATITRHLLGDIKSTNGILASSMEEQDIYSLSGFGLFSFDWNLKPFAVAEFVKTWHSSADHMMDKLVLRDDMTWSDGKPITAHDVVFSFETIMNPKVPVPAVRAGTDKIRAIVAYDDRTLVYFHKQALASNVWNLNFPLIPKHIYEKSVQEDVTLTQSPYHQKQDEDPVSGGPYTISRRVRGQEIVLERRESYYMHDGKQVRAKPYFKTVRYSVVQDPNVALLALKKGDLDEMQVMPEQWTTQMTDDDFYRANTKARDIEWLYFYFGWNMKTPFFDDVRVRKAMSYTMDYKEMLDKLAYGLYEPSQGMFHKSAWMFPKNAAPAYEQNLDKAEELLDEAGWTDSDGDGIRDKTIDGKSVKFEFTMLCASIPLRIATCTLMKENLEKIGVICNIRPIERTVMQQRLLDHDYEAQFGGWGTGADPSTLDNIFETGETRNFGFYSNPEVDKLLAQGEKEFDRAKQAEIYGRIHEIIYQDQPYTFLYFQSAFYAFNKQLRGYQFSPRGPYHFSPGFAAIWRAAAQ
ncbi:MAG: peptide-binding protein [Pirellulales bacterium]